MVVHVLDVADVERGVEEAEPGVVVVGLELDKIGEERVGSGVVALLKGQIRFVREPSALQIS